MEAYLSDKITKADFLKEQTRKVTDVLLEPDKAEKTFKIGPQSILYDDLKKVEKLYNVTLLADFWPADVTVRTGLEQAVKIRHDCVHRNGADTSGNFHSFDDLPIRPLAQRISALVDHIEDKAKDATSNRYGRTGTHGTCGTLR